MRNDSNLVVTVSSSVVKQNDNPQPPLTPQPYKYFVSYSASQSNGQSATVLMQEPFASSMRLPQLLTSLRYTNGLTNFYSWLKVELDYGDTDSSALYLEPHSTS